MEKKFDIAVIGGGPAGLSAALTGRIRNKRIALFDHTQFTPKLRKAHVVDNYIGLPQVSGDALVEKMAAHCMAHEPDFIREKVVNIFPDEEGFTLLTPQETYEARAVIITTGVVVSGLFDGEKQFLGRGVSYCATCDGMFYKGRDVAVISYIGEGEEEASYLGEICNRVYYLPQYKNELRDFNPAVQVVKARPRSIEGAAQVERLVTDKETLRVHGVFIVRQSDPVENVLPGLELDGQVIKVDRSMATNIPGVFAAGDCTGKPWQIAKAAGEGLVAVLSAISYLDKNDRAAGAAAK